jgi:hypothetical protein
MVGQEAGAELGGRRWCQPRLRWRKGVGMVVLKCVQASDHLKTGGNWSALGLRDWLVNRSWMTLML